MPVYESIKNADNKIKISAANRDSAVFGWDKAISFLADKVKAGAKAIAIDGWYGIDFEKIAVALKEKVGAATLLSATDLYKTREEIVAYNDFSVRIISSGFDVDYGATDPDADILTGKYQGPNVNPTVGMKTLTLDTKYTGIYADMGITKPVSITWQTSDLVENCQVTIDGVVYATPLDIPGVKKNA